MKVKFLVVDDSAVMRKMVIQTVYKGTLFNKENSEFYQAGNGEEGLVEFGKINPHVVLTDWNMPKMNGLEMVKKIRETNKTTSIVIITTEGTEDRVKQGMDAGATGYVVKPLKPGVIDDYLLDMLQKMKESGGETQAVSNTTATESQPVVAPAQTTEAQAAPARPSKPEPTTQPEPNVDREKQQQAEEAKIRAEVEARLKAETEQKIRLEMEAKAKAEAELEAQRKQAELQLLEAAKKEQEAKEQAEKVAVTEQAALDPQAELEARIRKEVEERLKAEAATAQTASTAPSQEAPESPAAPDVATPPVESPAPPQSEVPAPTMMPAAEEEASKKTGRDLWKKNCYQFLDHSKKVVPQVLKEMVDLDASFAEQVKVLEGGGMIATTIGITSKEFTGSISILYPSAISLKIASNMLSMPATEINDDVKDAVGEMTNLICGGLKTDMASSGIDFDISIPTVVVGSDFQLKTSKGVEFILITFEVPSESTWLNFQYAINTTSE